jgi:Mrp family chromosome partitioning ATPase
MSPSLWASLFELTASIHIKMANAQVSCASIGAVIVSTAQDVALADVKKGVAMFKRVKVPVRLQ